MPTRARALACTALAACSADFARPPGADPGWAVTAGDGGEASRPAIVLNEVMPRNDSTIVHGGLGFPDWVELYNADVAEVALTRVSLRGGTGDTWVGPAGRVIAPGEHLVLWAGDDDAWDTLPFALDADDDTLSLAIDGEEIDSVRITGVPGDVSVARFPDGGTWDGTDRPTPGGPNGRAPDADPDPSAVFYNDDHITDVWLTLDDAGISSLWADPYTEVPGSLAFEGAFFPEVGIRLKGVYGSLRNLSQKCSFKIDVNQYADQRLRGLETLAFNNLVQDPSYVHEYLTYTLFRAMGVPAPRVGWVRVYLNGAWYGLYANVEYPDDRFLTRWYADPTGNLYEGEYGEDFYANYLWEFDQDEGDPSTDRADLAALIAALDVPADDAGYANLRQYVDMDEFTAVMAVEATAYHWDGYTTANNYRVYHDPSTGLFTMIPWGSDQTWHDAYYEPYDGGGRLMRYCMSNASCTALYGQKLREAADLVESLGLDAQMTALYGFLYADMAADPRREWGMDTVESWISQTHAVIQAAPARVRASASAHGG